MKREPRGRVDINWFSPDVNGEYKYTRKMYAQHKNMQSGGFTLGDDNIAKKYVERGPARVDYKEELMKRLALGADQERKSMPVIQSHAHEDSTPVIVREDPPPNRTPPKQHYSPFQRATISRQPFEDITKSRLRVAESPLRAAANQSLMKPNNPKTDRPYGGLSEVPPVRGETGSRSVSPYFKAPAAARDLTPPRLENYTVGPKNASNKFVHELASHPLFSGPRYTKRSPKLHLDNPITGKCHAGVPPEYSSLVKDGSAHS